jgi:hypothetical protein
MLRLTVGQSVSMSWLSNLWEVPMEGSHKLNMFLGLCSGFTRIERINFITK